MRAIDQIRNVVQRQLFAVIAPDQKGSFRAHLFRINVTRFMTQCFILILMDICSLLMYLVYYAREGTFLPWHLHVHATKIAAMPLLILYLSRMNRKGYNPASRLDRNIELLYPALHFLLEFALFASGPMDLGAFLRLAAVPFIMGSIPVIPQRRAFVLELAAYLILSIYVPRQTIYGLLVKPFAFFINVWGVVFVCANLISFTVYSWFVRTYTASQEAEQAQQELLHLNGRLRDISRRDSLTGLLNRRGFQEYMDTAWRTRGQTEETATVMMMDIDYFKLLNDKYGHLVGDECLIRITDTLSKALDPMGYTLARYGGEEFVAVRYNHPHGQAVLDANRLRMQVFSQQIDNPDSDVAPYVTISIGVATRPVHQTASYDTLINEADECLYFAKRYGRNQIIHATPHGEGRYDIHGTRIDLASEGSLDDTNIRKAFREMSVDCMFVYDRRQGALINNNAMVSAYHVPERLENPTLDKIAVMLPITHEDRRVLLSALRTCIEARQPFFSIDVHMRMQNKEERLVSIRTNLLYDEAGAVTLAHGTMLSIEKIIAHNDHANRHALINTTTLLPNRQKLTLDLKEILGKPDGCGYLLMLDIKRFREINGVFGHSVGEKVLCEVSVALSRLSGTMGPVYHYGVDQFALILQTTQTETIEEMVRSIEHYFATQSAVVDGMDRPIAFCAVAVAYTPQTSLDLLLIDLDIAIQLVKMNDCQAFMFFTMEEREQFLSQFNLNKALVQAVQNDLAGFMLFYQPIINSQTKQIIGAEALLRWRDASGNIIPPVLTIPLLEKSGLMARVEPWIFETVCADCGAWIRRGAAAEFFVNINLSPNTITRPTLEAELHAAMARHGLTSRNLTLEVPETAAITEMRSTIEILSSLRAQGIRIAIDDFGSGYSSLSYLSTLPADEVKIDRSFVMDIESNDQASAFLHAVVNLAKTMDYVVCVEGVETDQQSDLITQSKADYLQGFLYGKPMDADAFCAQLLSALP